MKKYLILYAVIVTVLHVWGVRHYRSENKRLSQNQTALMSGMEHYRTKAGEEAASAQVLRLKVGEFERLRAADAAAIRALGIKFKRVEATARTATVTVVELRARLQDMVIVRTAGNTDFKAYDPLFGKKSTENTGFDSFSDDFGATYAPIIADTLRVFHWRDPWVTVEGLIDRDSVSCRVESADTLRQIVHRVPKKFLFFRWGTKAIRQEIISSNPHTRIVYAEYVKFEK